MRGRYRRMEFSKRKAPLDLISSVALRLPSDSRRGREICTLGAQLICPCVVTTSFRPPQHHDTLVPSVRPGSLENLAMQACTVVTWGKTKDMSQG